MQIEAKHHSWYGGASSTGTPRFVFGSQEEAKHFFFVIVVEGVCVYQLLTVGFLVLLIFRYFVVTFLYGRVVIVEIH